MNEQTTDSPRHCSVRCWTCRADLQVRADLLPTLPLHHRGDTAGVELCPRTNITPPLGAEQQSDRLAQENDSHPGAQQMVRKFHEAFGCPIRETPGIDVPEIGMRLALIREEVAELHDAVLAQDVIATADALGDIAYVVYGAALTFGIDLDAVLAEVHRSNMSKLGDDGKPIYREDGKVLKGPRFHRPDIAKALGMTAAPDEVEQVVQAWGLAAEGTDAALAGGYLVPEDVLERLGSTVEAMAGPLVALAAELAAERDTAREQTTVVEKVNNQLVRALANLVKHYPATSWSGSNDARDQARALLEEVKPGAPE